MNKWTNKSLKWKVSVLYQSAMDKLDESFLESKDRLINNNANDD